MHIQPQLVILSYHLEILDTPVANAKLCHSTSKRLQCSAHTVQLEISKVLELTQLVLRKETSVPLTTQTKNAQI